MQTCSRTNTGALDNNKQTDYTVVDVKFEAGESTQSSHDLINEFIGDSDTGDTGPENRRKRKYPQKLSMEEHDQQHDDDEEEVEYDLGQVVKVEYGGEDDHGDIADDHDEAHESEESMMAAWRRDNQQINCKQRDDCPVCGDKANGLHYGIYSCEGCKNFFKRSVVIVQTKPYVCPNQNNCDVRIVYDTTGIKRKGARCQSCRYTACLDAGMSHSGKSEFINIFSTTFLKIFLPGFPRSRGGRHSNGHVKYRQDQSSGSPGFKIAKVERVSKDESVSVEENEMDTSLDNSTGSDVWDNLNEQLR